MDLTKIDLFLLKAYMEDTDGLDTGFWSILTEVFVNSLFMLLNLIVLIFSSVLKVLEDFSVYDLFKATIFETSETIWHSLIGDGRGSFQTGSIVSTLLSLAAIYLFIVWFMGRSNFSQKVLHVLTVIILGFGYFGTIQGTDGGLFILDGIQSLSKEAVEVVNSLSIKLSTGEEEKPNGSLTDDYIKQTSYQIYLYVNTGRIDGRFFNAQTEQEEDFDHSKVVGAVDDNGTFSPVPNKDRVKYLDFLGDGAKENTEKNRWVSAVGDFLFYKVFYVLSSIYNAIIMPIPYFMIHFLRILFEILVLLLMLGFPFLLLFSFIPQFQNYLVGLVKLFLISSIVPSMGAFAILVVTVINLVISTGFGNIFGEKEATATNLLLTNFITRILSFVVYILIWKMKGFIYSILSGSSSGVMNGFNTVSDTNSAALKDGLSDIEKMVQNSFEFYEKRSFEVSPEELSVAVRDALEEVSPEFEDDVPPIFEEPEINPEDDLLDEELDVPIEDIPSQIPDEDVDVDLEFTESPEDTVVPEEVDFEGGDTMESPIFDEKDSFDSGPIIEEVENEET